jgi:hypothetical protein
MDVKEMISLMRTLGIGEVYKDNVSDNIALQYLNLSHEELYSVTAGVNDDLYLPRETYITNFNDTSFILNNKPFLISTIYRSGQRCPLEGKSVDNFDEYQERNIYNGDPVIYTNIGSVVEFYPISSNVSYTFKVRYKPEKTSFNLNTPESSIPYPVSYHRVLVNGALYYMFQDESGFKNQIKENEANKKWEEGKLDLINYLIGRSKQSISTYSNN